jgi:myo-inositol-1(or 4)-monophosphatase
MARRARSREGIARRKARVRRTRLPARWPDPKPAAGKTPQGRGARVVHLTEARRRTVAHRLIVARRRAAAQGRPGRETESTAPAALDFHLSACVACARAGGRVLMEYWSRRGSYPIQEKGKNDFVTIADRQAEEAVVGLIRERFPDHSIMAEESSPSTGPSAYRWYIDPLDGTTNFIHGYPLFSVSVGLADAQGMRAAAVFDPLRNEMFTAARGRGAFLNGEPIRVSAAEKLSQALLVTGFPFRSLDRLDAFLASFRSFILGASGIRRDGSAALDLAYVACGRYDGFWEMSLSPWDVAAGSLLVREAGGVVTDFRGRDDFLRTGDIVAANLNVHPPMLRVLRESEGKG